MPASPSLRLIALFAAIIAVTPLAIDMYLPALPDIAVSLQTNDQLVQQSLSIFLAFYACGMLLFGPMADAIGRRPLAVFGLFGFTVSSMLLSQVDSASGLLAGRALQAFTGSAATVVVPGLIRQIYQEHTAKGMSYVSMMMMLAPLVAPAIGSVVLEFADWRMIFWVLAAYSSLVLLIALPAFPKSTASTEPQRNKPEFFSAYRTVLSERQAQPLIAASMFASFSFFCFLTAVPFIYIGHFHADSSTFSLLFAANVLALIAANFVNSRLVVRCGSVYLLQVACGCAAAAVSLLLAVSVLDAPLWAVVLAIIPLMASLGISATNADALILIRFPQLSGTATAVIGTLRFGAGALAGPLLAFGGQTALLPFAILMAIGVAGIGASIWLSRQRQQAKPTAVAVAD